MVTTTHIQRGPSRKCLALIYVAMCTLLQLLALVPWRKPQLIRHQNDILSHWLQKAKLHPFNKTHFLDLVLAYEHVETTLAKHRVNSSHDYCFSVCNIIGNMTGNTVTCRRTSTCYNEKLQRTMQLRYAHQGHFFKNVCNTTCTHTD